MSKVICFMDFEYTTTGDKKKDSKEDCIELLSIAGIFVDIEKNEVKETFYEIVKPFKNTVLSEYCMELTKITQEEVNNARFMGEVVDDFITIYKKHGAPKCVIWGNFDFVALARSIRINAYTGEFKNLVYKMKNLQPEVSRVIRYNGVQISNCWALQKVKAIYGLSESNNKHNALSDAKDLWEVYIAYISKKKKNMILVKDSYDKLIDERLKISIRRQRKYEAEVKEIFSVVGCEKKLVKTGLNSSSARALVFNVPLEIRGCDTIGFHQKFVSILENKDSKDKILKPGYMSKGAPVKGSKLYRYSELKIEVTPKYIEINRFKKSQSIVEIVIYSKQQTIAIIKIPISKLTKKNIIMFIESNFAI